MLITSFKKGVPPLFFLKKKACIASVFHYFKRGKYLHLGTFLQMSTLSVSSIELQRSPCHFPASLTLRSHFPGRTWHERPAGGGGAEGAAVRPPGGRVGLPHARRRVRAHPQGHGSALHARYVGIELRQKVRLRWAAPIQWEGSLSRADEKRMACSHFDSRTEPLAWISVTWCHVLSGWLWSWWLMAVVRAPSSGNLWEGWKDL